MFGEGSSIKKIKVICKKDYVYGFKKGKTYGGYRGSLGSYHIKENRKNVYTLFSQRKFAVYFIALTTKNDEKIAVLTKKLDKEVLDRYGIQLDRETMIDWLKNERDYYDELMSDKTEKKDYRAWAKAIYQGINRLLRGEKI